jgi:hypothetical protein
MYLAPRLLEQGQWLRTKRGTLKITIEEAPAVVTIGLEGRVAGPWVDELSRTWCSLAPSLGRRELLIDLRNVIFIDRAGISLLAEIYSKTGAQFRADTPLMKYFAEEAMKNQSEKDGQKGA